MAFAQHLKQKGPGGEASRSGAFVVGQSVPAKGLPRKKLPVLAVGGKRGPQSQRLCLKEETPSNIAKIVVTRDTFQGERS